MSYDDERRGLLDRRRPSGTDHETIPLDGNVIDDNDDDDDVLLMPRADATADDFFGETKETPALHDTEPIAIESSIVVTDAPTTGIALSVFNLTNTVIGGGILSLPYAFHSAGLAVGLILLALTFSLGIYSVRMLLKSGRAVPEHRRHYQGIAYEAFGKVGVYVTDVSVVIATFGVMVSYFIIIGDMMSPLIGDWVGDFCVFLADRRFSIICSLVVLLPLSYLRNISTLAYTSSVAVIAILYLVAVVLIEAVRELGINEVLDCEAERGCVVWAAPNVGLFRAVPIITFAFTCQMNVFPIMRELRGSTVPRRAHAVVYLSFIVCLVIYGLVGTFGYLTFFDEVQGNFLINYEVGDPLVTAGRVAVAIVIMLSFPLMCHPCRSTIDKLIFRSRPYSRLRHILVATVLVGIAFAIAMLVTDVSLVFGIAGATASTMISFILPSAIYVKIRVRRGRPFCDMRNGFALSLFFLGCFFFVASTVITLIPDPNAIAVDSLCVRNETSLRNETFFF